MLEDAGQQGARGWSLQGHRDALGNPDYVWVPGDGEVEGRLLDEVLHPWQAAYAEWVREEQLHPEEQARMEMEIL